MSADTLCWNLRLAPIVRLFAMTGYFIESLIMSVAIQLNFQVFSTNAYQFATSPAPSFFARGKAKGISPHF
jgi:hypothetical protein